jgi:hypothetical protein
MWEDPIVAEVHRIRKELAARFDDDVAAMFADIRKRQLALGPRLVSLANLPDKSKEPNQSRDNSPKVRGTDAASAA